MSASFESLHVAVTGGTGALGTAVVERLLDAGATCHVPVFAPAELENFPFADHPRVRTRSSVDLTDAGAVDTFYDSLPSLWASVHCAGGFGMAPIADTSAADFDHLMRMNATTCFLCSRAAIVSIRQRGGTPSGGTPSGGRVVNVAARPSLEPRAGAGMVAYTMGKAAVAALTVALGEEVAAEDIWINAVAPSILDSPANRTAMPDADHSAWPSLADVAQTLVFLASPDNRTTRSAVVPVYGRS